MNANEYAWIWKEGSFWTDAVYGVVDASGQDIAQVTLPGYRNLVRGITSRHRIGRALIATKEGQFSVEHHSITDRDIRLISATDGLLVGQALRKKSRRWMKFRDTEYVFNLMGSSQEPSKARMTLLDPQGRTALTLKWSAERIHHFDLPSTNARQFHLGTARLGSGDPGAQFGLLTAFAYCVFMRSFLYGG